MEKESDIAGCGCIVLMLLINLSIGGWCTQYLLLTWFAKDIPWYADMIIGLFLGELTIPATVITFILKTFGVV